MSKVILIIGGGSGIGSQLISDLTDRGYKVLAASRKIEKDDVPKSVSLQKYDALSEDQLELPEELHGLVYCPGTINLKPFKRISIDQIREEFELNHVGAVKVIQQSIDALKKGSGSVVLFSTVAVQTGLPFHSSVAAAKGALEGFVRSMAAEFAPKVRFNAVAPSLTETPLAESLLNNDKKKERNAERHPLQRIGSVSDISSAVTYLLSNDSGWVTGQVLKVDGGLSALRSV